MGTLRPRVLKLARWAAHALLFLLCLEVAARVDDRITRGVPLWSRYDADILREQDANGIPRNRPGAHFEKWRIDSLGFRGEEIPREKPASHRRIICLGQSETFGLYESENEEWPAQLQRLLLRARPEVEVVNASVVGVDRRTRRQYIEHYVLPLRPDVVVLTTNVFFEATYRDPGAAGRAAAPRAPWRPAWEEGLRSRVLGKAHERLRDVVPLPLRRSFTLWRHKRTLRALERSKTVGIPLLDEVPAAQVEGFEAHLRAMIALLRAHGVTPLLMTYPTLGNEANMARDALEVAQERIFNNEYSELGLIHASRAINEAIRRVALEARAPLADAEAAVPKTPEYFADYVHYTDKGAAIVANCVAEALRLEHLLGPRP